MTGKRKKVPRPENEQLRIFKEELIIIDKETWEKTQKRWSDIKGIFPVRKKSKNNNIKKELCSFQSPSPVIWTYEMLKMLWSYCTY